MPPITVLNGWICCIPPMPMPVFIGYTCYMPPIPPIPIPPMPMPMPPMPLFICCIGYIPPCRCYPYLPFRWALIKFPPLPCHSFHSKRCSFVVCALTSWLSSLLGIPSYGWISHQQSHWSIFQASFFQLSFSFFPFSFSFWPLVLQQHRPLVS